jgi:hypothetical protein
MYWPMKLLLTETSMGKNLTMTSRNTSSKNWQAHTKPKKGKETALTHTVI